MILGIDVGGTTVKFGIVSVDGEILDKKAYDTHIWDSSASSFVENVISIIQSYQASYEISGIGIGLPGLLSADRRSTLDLANIPSLNNQPILSMLEKKIKNVPIKIENDAKCAALGEVFFGEYDDLDSYLMITLGTGVGGGLVINKKLFIGINGNATEIGHILLSDGDTLENHIGQEKISRFTRDWLKKEKYKSSLLQGKVLSPKEIFKAALEGDKCAKDVFFFVGECVGEMLVGVIRLLDLTTFLLAGGVAGASQFIEPGIRSKLEESLTPYYTKQVKIKKATLSADSGILGAASLIMHEISTVQKTS